jgi:hypothetical protein
MNGGTTATRDPDETRRQIAFEVQNVASAIALVASGAATRVTVAGLRFGEQVVARLGAEAASVGVRLEPVYWADDAGCDVIARKIDDA